MYKQNLVQTLEATMKSVLATKYKTPKLICLLILFCLTFHQLKNVSKEIKNNKKRLLQIQNYNLKVKNTINKRKNTKHLIESIKKITKTNYNLNKKLKYEHYNYKTPITNKIIINLVNLINSYTNTNTELIINKINNTVELIIPKQK